MIPGSKKNRESFSLRILFPMGIKNKIPAINWYAGINEVPSGFEPLYKVLQTSA